MYQIVFPQMANWLPDSEAEQLRFEFERELRRLTEAACGRAPPPLFQRSSSRRGRYYGNNCTCCVIPMSRIEVLSASNWASRPRMRLVFNASSGTQ